MKKKTSKTINAKFADKIVFVLEGKEFAELEEKEFLEAWESIKGLWRRHPIFKRMAVKEIIEWLRGEDCDI